MTRARPARGTRFRAACTFAGYVAVVVGLTWPLSAHLTTHLPAPVFAGDAMYSAWTLGWQTRALAGRPAEIADANIYAPTPRALFYGPLAEGALPVFAPVYLSTGNPVLAIDCVLIVGLAAFGWGMHRVTELLTGSWWAGLAAAGVVLTNAWIVWGFVPSTPHWAMLAYLPWIVAAAARPVLSPARAVVLWLLIVLQSLTDVAYLAPGVFLPLGILAAVRLARSGTRRGGVQLALVLCASGLTLAPLAVGFWRVLSDNPALLSQTNWSLEFIRRSRAVSEIMSPALAPTRRALYDGPLENVDLAGVGVATAGLLFAAIRRDRSAGVAPRVWAHGLLWCIVGLVASRSWLAMGPIRLPHRLGVPGIVGLGILAGAAVATIAAAGRARWQRALLAALPALAIWAVGYSTIAPLRRMHDGLPLRPAPRVPPTIAAALARTPGPLLELPLGPTPTDPLAHAVAVYRTLAHEHPVLNGYSSYWPASFPARMALASRLPDPGALADLAGQTGLRLVWVHLTALAPVERVRWEQAAAERTAWVALARDPGELLLAVAPSPASSHDDGRQP